MDNKVDGQYSGRPDTQWQMLYSGELIDAKKLVYERLRMLENL